MPRLSTHVLDTSLGKPAAGVAVELWRVQAGERQRLSTAVTNSDGRTDAPLFSGNRLDVGTYELMFFVGDYLRGVYAPVTDPPFLDDIVVRFNVADATGTYHVPLLLSPYGYSVYRGS
jgi:5-hydroxyisourate hydrolase